MSGQERELFRKYNVAGPRYTSYPTVPYWDTTPSAEQWLHSVAQGLNASRKSGAGAAIYVHVPFCQSLCTYCGCNTRITRRQDVGTPYVRTVLAEWRLYREMLLGQGVSQIPLSELHLGGGTPTFLAPAELEELVRGILEGTELTPSHEFSVEADPRVTTPEHLATLARLGFKRLSLGIQDFDSKVQEVVHRVQSVEQVQAVTVTARNLGFTSVNYDLIYGLPFQTKTSVEATVQAVMKLRPDRIAYYGYAHVPWIKPSQRRFTEADLPDGNAKRELYELGRTLLEQAGYAEVGMDHFALKTDSLWVAAAEGELHRNFMGYTSRSVSPLIGLGVSAIGDSWTAFAQNEKVLETYQERVAQGELPILRGHVLNEEDQILRRHILNLMTQFNTDWQHSSVATDYLAGVGERLAELARDGLVELTAQGCRVRERGKPFLRNVCMAFDARLARRTPDSTLFSKTV